MRTFRIVTVLVMMAVAAAQSAVGQELRVTFEEGTVQAGAAVQHVFDDDPLDTLVQVTGGVASGDIDGDGWPDLFVIGGDGGRQYLLRNRQDGTFSETAIASGVDFTGEHLSGPAFADIDGDGDLDLFVGIIPRMDARYPVLALNDGTGHFAEISRARRMFPAGPYIGATFGDYDGDGHLDLFTSHWSMPLVIVDIDHLWRNDGRGVFHGVDAAAGLEIARLPTENLGDFIFNFTANFVDIDSDGLPDLLLAADFGTSQIFRNSGEGRFTDISDAVLTDENGMGAAIGDFDNDGHFDWFVTSIFDPAPPPGGEWGGSGNRLYRNLGDGRFEDVTTESGVRDGAWGWGACAADFDNDGHLDIFHVNGWASRFTEMWVGRPALLFMNNGDGSFAEQAVQAGIDDRGEGRGVVCFDYDRDGDVDVFVGNTMGRSGLYRNMLDGRANFLQIKLAGRPPNTEGIGARVYVRHAGLQQMRELRAGSNYVSQDPAVAHFGLGTDTQAGEVEVVWPGGERLLLRGVAANQHLVLYQQAGDANCDGTSSAADFVAALTAIAATPSAAPCPGADLNYDGSRDFDDFRLVLERVFAPSSVASGHSLWTIPGMVPPPCPLCPGGSQGATQATTPEASPRFRDPAVVPKPALRARGKR